MRGDIIYHVYGVHRGRKDDEYFGAFRTHEEAQAEVEKLKAMKMGGRNWAAQCHNKGFTIREVIVDTDFEIPSQPKPRDKYVVKTQPKPNEPGTWDSTLVEVYRRDFAHGKLERICEYERNYRMLQTFEPFRQGNREFALISRDYTRTSVLDLASGNIIATDPLEGPPGSGFCPVGFYVPDWWDVHNGSIIPGSKYWSADKEWPLGDFGFVWGCYWGDDSSWKVQYLDLSRVQQGIITRHERFGYVELATNGYLSPCFTLERSVATATSSPHFIHVWKGNGAVEVTFAVEMAFNLDSGKPEDWQRIEQ